LIGFILTGLLCCSFYFSQAQVSFRTLTSVNVPDQPYEIAKGDFNGDGRMDFITANFTASANQQVTILINTGTGTFTGGNIRNFPASTHLIDVAVGDFNEDGNLDAIASSDQNDNFSLLLGDGAGNLAAPINFSSGARPYGIAVGDMNKDNNLDVLVAHSGPPDDIYIFLGNGAGGFAAPVILPNPTNTTYDITVADFNLDTNPDFAISTAGIYTVQIWTGNGSGTSYTVTQTIPSMGINPDIDARDLNGDGAMDLIGSPGYIMNNGTGTFGARVILAQSDDEYMTGDLNNDGKVDLIATDQNQNGGQTRVYLGDGAGVFTLLAKFEVNVYGRGLELGDVNNDGNLDVLSAGSIASDGRVDVLLGDGTGFMVNTLTKYPVASDPRDLTVADFNSDGNPDVALSHTVGNFVTIYMGQGGDRFQKTATNYTTGTFPIWIHAFDYNGDGNLDLVTCNQNGSSVTVLTGQGNGAFTSLGNFSVPTNPFGITVADFNNDTRPDIATGANTANAIYLLTGTGSGFNAAVTIPVSNNIQQLTSADFNSDNNMDIATVFTNTNQFLVFAGNGAGGFTPGPTLTTSTQYLEVADITGDSKPDVIGYGGGSATVHLFLNDGSGIFSLTNFPSTSGQFGLAFADLNGDGSKDLVTGAQNSGSSSQGVIRAYRGTGTGVSTSSLFSRQLGGGNKLKVVDLNGDGKRDIVATSFNIYEDYLAIWINTTVLAGCPSITLHPSTQTTCTGLGISLVVSASGNTPLSYQWYKGPTPLAGATSSNLVINPIAAGDAGSYTCVVSYGCGSATSNPAVLTVNTTPSPPGVVPGSRCGAGSVNLQATGASNGDYRWYATLIDPSPISGETNEFYATPSLTNSRTYFTAISISGCESSRVSVTATINTPPPDPEITSSIPGIAGTITICSTTSLTLTAPAGYVSYLWNNAETTQQISPTVGGSYQVTVTDAAGCSNSTLTPANVVVVPAPCNNTAPTFTAGPLTTPAGSVLTVDLLSLVSDADDNLILGTLQFVAPPQSGASYELINGSLLELDYTGVSFSGTDQLTVQVCDAFGECPQGIIQVNVIGGITVFNAVSPNGDGKNDTFIIQYIDNIPETQQNKLTILNRWGTVVFEATNYNNSTNVFKGLSTNGTELPSGTYYYTVEFASGAAKRTGFISLRR